MPKQNHDVTRGIGQLTDEKDLPTTEKAWEAVMKRVDGIDDGMNKGWKEDIDTLRELSI
ncbi:hypothetical protein AAF712_015356 [Marasmius tenuissimus]|uniref:Uncharacterized protein n=1 Tax=Marasmius tenuissimus TaxID=585030 RepID=A0ABR2Z9J0_9AGAR|nr:hypothetical protein PM082_004251 [Marasmius tenuissimus]